MDLIGAKVNAKILFTRTCLFSMANPKVTNSIEIGVNNNIMVRDFLFLKQ